MAVAKVQLHAFLTLALAEDGWSISCPRCSTPKGMRPQYPLNSKLDGSQSQSGCFGEEKNILLLLASEPWLVQPVA